MGVGDAAVRVETIGLDELIKDMKRLRELGGEAAMSVIRAGANELQRGWLDEAKRRKHVKTGDMIKGVTYTRPRDRGHGLQVDVYPMGYGRPRGKKQERTQNNVKAFVLHHGRKGKRPIGADKWVEAVAEKAGPPAQEAMADTWGKFIETGTIPNVPKLQKGKK